MKKRIVIVKTTTMVALTDGDPYTMSDADMYALAHDYADEVEWGIEAHIPDPAELDRYADEFGYLRSLEPKETKEP